MFDLYDIRLVGRETLDGHDTVVATLEPKPAYRPRTDAGKWMKKLRARVWISESDYQVVKAAGHVIDDVTFGWGIVGRLHSGTVAEFERTQDQRRGLAAGARGDQGHGTCAALPLQVDSLTLYSDYKKFNVSTDEHLTPH